MQIPVLHGNWVDFIILLFIGFYVLEGWGRGFLTQVFELLVFVTSFALALKFYPFTSELLMGNFAFPQGLSNALGFFLTGIFTEQILAYLFGKLHERMPQVWHQHKINRYLAIVPLFLNALVVVAFVLTLVLGLPVKGSIKTAITGSRIGGVIVGKTQSIERTFSGIFGEALADTLNFITINPKSSEQVDLHFTQKELSIDEKSETEMLVKVNAERRSRGLKDLVINIKLRDLAREYARDMFERGYFSHYNPEGQSPFDRMEEVGIIYKTAGENLALAPGVGIAHQGLMDSPGHRANILNSEFGLVGIGVIDGGIYGKMFVQEFTD